MLRPPETPSRQIDGKNALEGIPVGRAALPRLKFGREPEMNGPEYLRCLKCAGCLQTPGIFQTGRSLLCRQRAMPAFRRRPEERAFLVGTLLRSRQKRLGTVTQPRIGEMAGRPTSLFESRLSVSKEAALSCSFFSVGSLLDWSLACSLALRRWLSG
jgi:hypothetical protein